MPTGHGIHWSPSRECLVPGWHGTAMTVMTNNKFTKIHYAYIVWPMNVMMAMMMATRKSKTVHEVNVHVYYPPLNQGP